MIRWTPIAALLLVGCAQTPPASEVPSAPKTPSVPVTKGKKGGEPIPPTNIGDASPIEFSALHGMRKGQGSFKAESTATLVGADFALETDGTFRVEFSMKDGATRTVGGTWRKEDGKTVHLVVDRLDDAKIGPFSGKIEFMDRANPSRLEIGSEDKAAADLQVRFKVLE